MMEYLPWYYQASKIMGAILSAHGQEIDKLFEALDQTLDQYFAVSATWGLSLWEELLGLPVDEALSIEERRQRILAKRRGTSQPLLAILQAIAPRLEVRFGGDVIPFILPVENNAYEYDFGLLIPTFEIYKPAHKSYSFQLLPPDPSSGYTIYGDHNAGRDMVALQPETGAVYAGRWPRWNTPGQTKTGNVIIQAVMITGECIFPIAGVSIGSVSAANIILSGDINVGKVIFPRSGEYRTAELPITTTMGVLLASAVSIVRLDVTGRGIEYPCGTIYAGEVAA
jgi:hypothetical protein